MNISLLKTMIKDMQEEVMKLETEVANGSNETTAKSVHYKEIEKENEELREEINLTNQRIATLASGEQADYSILNKSKITF